MENTIDRYEIYEVTIPRNFHFPHIDDKVNITEKGYYLLAKHSIGLYWEGEFTDYATITAVNRQYYLHPGSNRYLVARTVKEFNEVKALVINRWGTTYEMIKQDFPDAKLYRESFVGYMNFRDALEPGEGALLGHGLKPYRTVNKNAFDQAAKSSPTLLQYNPKGLEVIYNGERKVILGNQEDFITVNISTIYEYIQYVLVHFTDFEP